MARYTQLDEADVEALLDRHLEGGATWAELAAPLGCPPEALLGAVQEWESGAVIRLRGDRAWVHYPAGQFTEDMLREGVAEGLSDAEIAERHGVPTTRVGDLRRALGLAGGHGRGTPAHDVAAAVLQALQQLGGAHTVAGLLAALQARGCTTSGRTVRAALKAHLEQGAVRCQRLPTNWVAYAWEATQSTRETTAAQAAREEEAMALKEYEPPGKTPAITYEARQAAELEWLARGLSPEDIAAELGVEPSVVHADLREIRAARGVGTPGGGHDSEARRAQDLLEARTREAAQWRRAYEALRARDLAREACVAAQAVLARAEEELHAAEAELPNRDGGDRW